MVTKTGAIEGIEELPRLADTNDTELSGMTVGAVEAGGITMAEVDSDGGRMKVDDAATDENVSDVTGRAMDVVDAVIDTSTRGASVVLAATGGTTGGATGKATGGASLHFGIM